jgi:predicted nuclease with TOPRIM domain
MASERKNLQKVRTMGQLVDGRRARTSAGALLELSMLEMEKTRLTKETQRLERRGADIRQRLEEIDAKQDRLKRFVAAPREAKPQESAAADLPVYAVPQDRVKKRRLCY